MSQVTLTTTTPPMNHCLFCCKNHNCDCYNCSHFCGGSSFGSAWCVSSKPLITRTHWEVLVSPPCHCSNLNPGCLLRLMPVIPWVLLRWVFFFRLEHSTNFFILISYDISFLFSGSNVNANFIRGRSTVGVCTTATLCGIPMTGICTSWCWSITHDNGTPSRYSLHCFK